MRRSCVFAKVIYVQLEGFDISKCINYINLDVYCNSILEIEMPRLWKTCMILRHLSIPFEYPIGKKNNNNYQYLTL